MPQSARLTNNLLVVVLDHVDEHGYKEDRYFQRGKYHVISQSCFPRKMLWYEERKSKMSHPKFWLALPQKLQRSRIVKIRADQNNSYLLFGF